MRKLKFILVQLSLIIVFQENIYGQVGDLLKIFAEFKRVEAYKKVSYDYDLLLVNKKTGVSLDSISGKLFKDGPKYLDSNMLFINIRDDNYAVQINNQSNTVYLKDIRRIRQLSKSDLDVEIPMINQADLTSEHIESLNIREAGGKTYVRVKFKGLSVNLLSIVLGGNKRIERIEMSIPDGPHNSENERMMFLKNISEVFDSNLLETKRLIVAEGNSYKLLNGKYKSYKIIKII